MLSGLPPNRRPVRLPWRVRAWLVIYRWQADRRDRAIHQAAGHSCSFCDAHARLKEQDRS